MQLLPARQHVSYTVRLFHMTIYVLEDCMAVEACRIREGVRDFFKSCRFAGVSQCRAYKLFLNGMGPDGTKVPRSEHLHRGASLIRLTQTWLNTWE